MHASSSAIQSFRILVVPGDGIGLEVVPAAVQVLRASGLPFEFVPAEAGWACFERHGTSLPDETLAAARVADAILFGAVASPSQPVDGYRSPIVALRHELDLYANIRPVADHRPPTIDHQIFPSVVSRRPPALSRAEGSVVDLVVVRENTEGLYAGQETSDGETAVARRVITRRASERIARVAFELARSRATTEHRAPTTDQEASTNGRRSSKVTIVHKANVLRETCGLFRTTALRVAEEYPDVAVDELLVDSAALQLVQRPERFDVIVTTNLFGDILSDVASYWGGGLGMAVSANIGGDRRALFEPVHGSAPDIAGRGVANPLAAIGCAALLLEHLGRPPTADHRPATSGEYTLPDACLAWAGRIRAAIRATLASGICTPDLGGSARTEDVTSAVIASMIEHL